MGQIIGLILGPPQEDPHLKGERGIVRNTTETTAQMLVRFGGFFFFFLLKGKISVFLGERTNKTGYIHNLPGVTDLMQYMHGC